MQIINEPSSSKALNSALARVSQLPRPASMVDSSMSRVDGYDDYSDSVYVDCPYDDYQDKN